MATMPVSQCGLLIVALLAMSIKSCAPTRTYRGINIELREDSDISRAQCRQILNAIEATLTSASAALHAALDGRYFFEDFNIYLPASWDDECLPTEAAGNHSSVRRIAASIGGYSDVIVSSRRGRHGEPMWSQQYGPCGTPAQRMHAAYDGFMGTHAKTSLGRMFVKEWAKYRYGVFDENGHNATKCYRHSGRDAWRQTGCADQTLDEEQENDICQHAVGESVVSPLARTSLMFAPAGESVSMFCDNGNHNRYAPTQQNQLCGRRSTLDVIMAHNDFDNDFELAGTPSSIVDTTPRFNYRRRGLTRYVVIVDDSLDSAVRESWSFLRSAFRKWLLYDLLDNSEVGVVLASGRDASKTLRLTSLANDTNRDRVASFLPYTPTDMRQTICVACAVEAALRLLEQRQQAKGAAAQVILIVAPGMAKAEATTAVRELVANGANPVQLATINYPHVLAGRQPLDALADNDMSFTVHEQKYNSERSYLTGYVRLTNVLLHIAASYFERTGLTHAPLELHRREIHSSNELHVHGEFYLDGSYAQPAGFFIYTHSVEAPLLQSMRLISPSGVVVEARSDQRMPVKQITLLTSLNETGWWSYELARYPGNPQPHIVQVLATPHGRDIIATESRIIRQGADFLLYTLISEHGRELGVNNATVTITHRHDWQSGATSADEYVLELYDDGNGDIDIQAGDGIYSRRLTAQLAGIYSFEFSTVGKNFARYSPIYTRHLPAISSSSSASSPTRLILDFACSADVAAERFNCSWSSHAGQELLGFELRYAFNIEDLIDHFSQADMLTESPAVADTKWYLYQHDVATTPFLHGETIFIALRPKFKDSTWSTSISNIAEVYIAAPLPTTIAAEDDDDVTTTPSGDDVEGVSATPPVSDVEPREPLPFGLSQLAVQLLAACFALFFILLAILLFCYLRKCWCKIAKAKKATAERDSTKFNQHEAAETAEAEAADQSYRRQQQATESVHTSLSLLEVKLQDHHKIGIPVFSEPEYQNNQTSDAHSHYGLNNSFYSGMNIISTSVFDSGGGGNDGGDSWYATQHLECSGPPVPPLPYPLLQLSTQNECDFTLQHHRLPLPPPPPPPTLHCQQQIMPIEASCPTAVTDPRRCRNVTMV